MLSIYISDHESDKDADPLIHYYMGYWLLEIGKDEEAMNYFKLGARINPEFVFPHRIESERVLRRVVDASPDDGKA